MKDRSRETVDSTKHVPSYDSERINRVVEMANRDPEFVSYAVARLANLQFPAFKHIILDYARNINAGEDVIALLESLDGYIEFRDQYHMYKALQKKVGSKNRGFQTSDQTRENPNVRARPTTPDASIKDREAANESEERKDYPEVTPTAMSNFICDRCGKPFQNQDDLAHHRQFEG